MTTISVDDMHCEKCVERITNIMNEEHLEFLVNLNEKTVSIEGDETQTALALELLEDIGFTPVIK